MRTLVFELKLGGGLDVSCWRFGPRRRRKERTCLPRGHPLRYRDFVLSGLARETSPGSYRPLHGELAALLWPCEVAAAYRRMGLSSAD